MDKNNISERLARIEQRQEGLQATMKQILELIGKISRRSDIIEINKSSSVEPSEFSSTELY